MTHLTHYQEITLLPEPDISSYFIWSKLFTQLHIALADVKNCHSINSIGVAFPDYYFDQKNGKSSKLGNKLRIFAPSQEDLTKLNLTKWLGGLIDYVHIKPIKDVPSDIKGYVSVHRYRFKPIEVQAQSLAEKLNISLDDAMATLNARLKRLCLMSDSPAKPIKHLTYLKCYSNPLMNLNQECLMRMA